MEDWEAVIERNRNDLLRILGALFAMAGLTAQGEVLGSSPRITTLPRHVYSFVLKILKTAESAVRRLVVIAAHGLVVALPAGPARKPKPASVFVRDGTGTGIVLPKGMKFIPGTGTMIRTGPRTATRTMSFQLFDPLKRFGPERRFVPDRCAPHVRGLDTDPLVSSYLRAPRPAGPVFTPPPPSPDDPIGAARLSPRLHALKTALDDIPAQARRLALWQARSRLGHKVRPRRLTSMRGGFPPGHRKRRFHEIDDVLSECQIFALRLLNQRPDTS